MVWADSDIVVGPGWAPAVKAAFGQAPIVQCFSAAAYRNEEGATSRPRPSALCPGTGGVLGVCWGAERSLFTSGPGLFEMALAGGGDAIFAAELAGENPLPSAPWAADHPSLLHQSWSGPLIAELDQWRATVRQWMAGKAAAAAEVAIEVLVHGPNRERRYFDRQSLLAHMDPGRHLVRDPDRAFRWSADGLAEIEPAIRAYFFGRREDETVAGRAAA